MKRFILIVSLLYTINAIGQYPKYINDSLLATFCNVVLENTFREDGINCGLNNSKEFIIQTDLDTARLIKRIGYDRLTYYKVEESLRSLLTKPWESNNGKVIYWIRPLVYNQDSVDFDIINATLQKVTEKTILSPWCCGGDLPRLVTRFVYNREAKIWKHLTAYQKRDLMDIK